MTQISPLRRITRQLFTVSLLPGFAFVLLIAMWIAVFHQLTSDQRNAHHEAVLQSQSLARTLAEHVTYILRQTDHATQLFRLEFNKTKGQARLEEFIRPDGLMDSVLPAKLELPIGLVDAEGNVIDSQFGFPTANVKREAYFRNMADGSGPSPQFSTPMIDPLTHKWMIQVARRLTDADGNFAGAIVIMVDPGYFVDDYDRLSMDERGALLLVAPQAGLAVGRVGEHIFISDTLKFGPPARGSSSEELAIKTPFDAIDRIYSSREMSRFALTAVVGIPADSALARFMDHRQTYLSLAVAASLMIIAIVAGLMRQSARLRASMHAARQAQSYLAESAAALRESEARIRTIANTVPAMIAYIDSDTTYRFHNAAYDREFGLADKDVNGRTIREIVGDERYAGLEPYIRRVMNGETVVFEESDLRDGVERTLEVTYIPQFAEDRSAVVGFHVMRQDITMQKREKTRLLRLAQVDVLTGLTNRAGFEQKLGDAMAAADAGKHLMAVMYMDIDHFKPVNDTYGHDVGDALLKAFSSRLTHTLRASDTIARLGGDEFTIIMEKINKPEDASVTASKIVAAMRLPFDLNGISVSISTSIGLAYYGGEGRTPEDLLKEADKLLYKAKQEGRDTFRAAA